MKIRKAVIPAAGLGTRVLPATKAMPKEMIPIVDKPAIQYIVEEAVKSGITDILIIISRGKSIIEDHFDRMPELEKRLEVGGKHDSLKDVIDIARLANISFVRQQEQLGLGHAILQAKNFVGDEPFAVLYGDDVIIGEDPCIGQLCRAYDEYQKCTVCMKEVPLEDIKKYSSLKVDHLKENLYNISDMVEKPQTEAETYSLYSILGRCILTPEIFSVLESIPFGAGNELQLTDAMKVLARRDGFIGVDFTGTRYDMGNKLGILKASVEVALSREDLRDDFAKYLASLDLLNV
jgi:UTP--glucose-1-phosphate uridylyltransferase